MSGDSDAQQIPVETPRAIPDAPAVGAPPDDSTLIHGMRSRQADHFEPPAPGPRHCQAQHVGFHRADEKYLVAAHCSQHALDEKSETLERAVNTTRVTNQVNGDDNRKLTAETKRWSPQLTPERQGM